MPDSDADITQLLRSISDGDRRNLDSLMDAIYKDLHRLAASHMRSERRDHTLQPTALVNEVYLKLIDQHSANWKNRIQFFAVASRLIRRILVDHARERGALKRGGDHQRVSIRQAELEVGDPGVDVAALDEALTELASLDPRQAEIVELRFFGGLTIDEIAAHLDIGKRSVDRDWKCAKVWLYWWLTNDGASDSDG